MATLEFMVSLVFRGSCPSNEWLDLRLARLPPGGVWASWADGSGVYARKYEDVRKEIVDPEIIPDHWLAVWLGPISSTDKLLSAAESIEREWEDLVTGDELLAEAQR